ncbi:MAG: DVU0150 family protein [Pseudodesulfovibrio sp.]|uniref:DVU0150 family protein n=1 Tax=Pseudodesulfovibrio sp. TaxID=2035812 RepID=UPI003D0BBA28
MKKRLAKLFGLFVLVQAALPSLLWAAGKKAHDLVVVADIRMLHNSVERYFADVYNTDPVLLAIWAVVLTAGYGCFLGLVMDFIMSRTGLDLRSRKIVEH